MASVSPGKRLWKCPECGNQLELSATQLDPIACDACLTKMRTGGRARSTANPAGVSAGPIGFWSALPEIVKLSAVLAAFLGGLWLGYLVGRATAPKAIVPKTTTTRPEESHRSATVTEPASEPHAHTETTPTESHDAHEERPPAPGPDYHWVRGRTLKDGTRGKGYWAKNRNSGSSESNP